MLRKLASLLVIIVAFAMARPAQADLLTYSSYSVIAPRAVTLSGDALGRQETAGAGEITLLGVNGGTGTLSTFCIDVADWLTPSGQFSTGAYLIGSLAEQVNALLTHVLPQLGTDGDASAALQVAIWKAEYGAEVTVAGDDNIVALANAYLDSVQSGGWTADPSMRVAVLGGGGIDQSQAYLTPVPEPTSLAVLAVAVLGALMWQHRRLTAIPRYCRVVVRSISSRRTG